MRQADICEGRRPQGSQEPRVPGGHHPDRRPRAHPARPRGLRRAGRRASGRRSPTRSTSPPAPRCSTPPTTCGAAADMVLKVKEPVAEEYHRMREGQTLFTYLHLAADQPLTEELVAAQGHRDRLRDRAAALRAGCRCSTRCPRSPAAWRPQVGAHSLMKAQGGRGVLHGRRRRRRQRQGRHHRRRRLGPERRQHRARHGRRRHPARHRPRQAADVVLALQQPGATASPRRKLAIRAAGDGGRPGHRRRADPRRQGTQAGHQRPGRRR